jgi:DNA-binding MarR family transcriptional regulator
MARKLSDRREAEPYRLAHSTSHLLHRAEQLAADRFIQLAEGRLTLRQFSVLAAVVENPGVSQIDLVRTTGIDRSTLADILKRLERNGLIARATSSVDARARTVRLTSAGLAAFKASIRHGRAADAAILDLLPRTKAKALVSTLAKLARLADEAAEKAERAARREAKREARKRQRERSQQQKPRKRTGRARRSSSES